MHALRLLSQLFWLLMWDLCYYLLHRPIVRLAHLTQGLCLYCVHMIWRIEAEDVVAILSRKGD